MAELRFDDRVAVITGAGRGLGRAYALLLAGRGAKVVVNDPGVSMEGEGTDAGPAQQVVGEITACGGEAVANTDSVATFEGGQAIIQSALDHYGRIDILIHNAGIVRRAPLAEMNVEEFDTVLDVHLRGGFHVVRAAFPHMCAAGYGRIVLTGSISGLYGNAQVVNYAVSKTGLIGLSNVAALEGAEHGVTCNVILPGALLVDGDNTTDPCVACHTAAVTPPGFRVLRFLEDHWIVVNYLREYYLEYEIAPMIRKLCRGTKMKLKRIYELFPSGPAKGACKVAGLPKPTGCV